MDEGVGGDAQKWIQQQSWVSSSPSLRSRCLFLAPAGITPGNMHHQLEAGPIATTCSRLR